MGSHILDDTDSSIHYSSRVWKPGSANDTYIIRDECFDDTYTAQHVSASDVVYLEIPFTGTSISLFIVTSPTCKVNTSITVDDEPPTIHSFYQTKPICNVQLYSSAPLPFGNHSVHVDLLSIANGVDTSCLFFDYAVINGAPGGASCPTTSMAGSPTCMSIDQQPSTSNLGLTGGNLGIVGGVLAFLFLIFCISSYWMHSTSKKRQEMDGTKLPLHVSGVGSQLSTLVQSSPPVSPPGPSLPAALLPSHSSTSPPLPMPSLSSQSPHSTRMPDQIKQPDTGIRIDARSTESNVTFNITSRN